jgi:hypothetical protein
MKLHPVTIRRLTGIALMAAIVAAMTLHGALRTLESNVSFDAFVPSGGPNSGFAQTGGGEQLRKQR